MKRIVSMLELSADLIRGLDNVTVEKIDLYKDKNILRLVLSGLPEDDNSLVAFSNAIKKLTECDLKIFFVSSNKENVASYVKALNPFFVRELIRRNPELCYADKCTFEVGEDMKLKVYLDALYDDFVENAVRLRMCSAVLDLIETMLNVTLEGSDFLITESPVYEDIPVDAYCDMDYNEAPPPAPADPYMPYLPPEVMAQMQAQEQQEKEQEQAAAAAEEEAPKVDKNSWAYKAKEQQKENKNNDQGSGREFYNNRKAEALFGRVTKDIETFDIKNVTAEETMVNVVGQLTLTDDLKLSKSGKVVIAKFNIIDKTGGIAGIMFVKPDEADSFEKMFKKGGWAGFQGEPQYNRGEFNLKVQGIFEAPKPPKRKDLSDMKRVELHVHSKMSEKDAVSDPAAIMKLAASFGHKACAITDHGVVQAFPEVYNTAKKLTVGDTDEKFKAILGCEGYLADDGPTIFYNLPFEEDERRHVGNIVSIAITTTGKDSCTDRITHIAASKYRLKGYKAVRIPAEGESDEDAMDFSKKDIDKSLWDPEEIPEELRDENIASKGSAAREDKSHILNADSSLIGEYAEDDIEFVPDAIEYEHVADFYAEVEDIIYQGTGEPCDSYYRVGELLEFIGDSYIAGPDIFNALAFIRRAGYGINIEDHVYYRHKFLMPAISSADILKYVYKENQYIDEAAACKDLAGDIALTGNELIDQCRINANFIIGYLKDKESTDPTKLNHDIGHFDLDQIKSKDNPTYHIIYLVRNNMGLYNMYRLISESHVHYFHRRPRTPKSLLKYFQSSIIVGGACERGEIYRAVLKTYKSCGKDRVATMDALKASEEFKDIMSLYAYVEIQPLCNNMFMTRQDPAKSDTGNVPLDANDIRIVNELLVEVADAFGLPCCATTDSHFLDPEDGMYRKYLLMNMGFADAEMQSDLYFRSTDEMLREFSYLGEEKAFEVVVENTNKIADMIEYGIKPFPDGTYPPIISRAAADVRDIAFTRANRLYRHNGVLNEVVKARLEKELKSIIGHGFAIMYYIAYRLVKKSNNDGYIVGSRGSVGSSFAATMCGISEVNPLPPHYRCPDCCYVEFDNSGEFGSGFDMEPKDCPCCGAHMIKDGQDIPFETFLGFNGDKEPDIDLNFSSAYQPRAHKYVEYLFGHTHTFRAGTIGTYADKNAIGVAKSVAEMKGLICSNAMLTYMSEGIVGVKRTTSQHPGGIVVVPKEMDVYEFTPIQYPANKTDCGIITTHFDFHAMHDTILKLDILGHADPTVLRMLQDLTKIEVTTIPVPDDKVMSLLESTNALGFPLEATEAGSATLGLSELGTHMARGMIKEAKPRRFYDLVQLMGLSHGTDVWTGNAQDLIRDGICDLNSVIGCRDSIMTRLIYWGVPNKDAFDIMENVRKGKVAGGAVPEKWEKWKETMKEHGVPDWYIGSCEKIKYMFPKAHAAAYSISTLRVAWFKVYYPEEYYCAFYTIRGDEFSANTMCQGEAALTERRRLLNELMHQDNNPKTKSEYYLCEIIEEMYHRGIEFLPIDINTSHATDFVKVEKGKILPPLASIDSISSSIAENITRAREEAPFTTREDLMQRSGIGKSALQTLADYGLLEDLPETSQIDIFSMLG
ncbi:DNA polymerase III, alpha chain [Ruminococcaceae bacterium KH2T8]|nr:DNA polymerase III, alpha chain [Ruminococcaceae bacterium KH2T8]